jgi:hypothetical protein
MSAILIILPVVRIERYKPDGTWAPVEPPRRPPRRQALRAAASRRNIVLFRPRPKGGAA